MTPLSSREQEAREVLARAMEQSGNQLAASGIRSGPVDGSFAYAAVQAMLAFAAKPTPAAPSGLAETVAELRALVARATPGPLHISTFEEQSDGTNRVVMAADNFAVAYFMGRTAAEHVADAHLYVAAINALPQLLTAIEQGQGRVEAGPALRALQWLAAERTVEELMRGDPGDWGNLTPEQRIEAIGKRKDARDAAVLDARDALSQGEHDVG